jgi:hypothetical protein
VVANPPRRDRKATPVSWEERATAFESVLWKTRATVNTAQP